MTWLPWTRLTIAQMLPMSKNKFFLFAQTPVSLRSVSTHLPDQVLREASDFVTNRNGHILCGGDMILVCCYFQSVALVQMNLLVVQCLAEEKFSLSYMHSIALKGYKTYI